MKPQVMKLLQQPALLDNLCKTSESLDQIEKSLEENLEVKRSAFPRFYFLSNDELIEIISHQTSVEHVQQHLNKCFEGISKLYLGDKA
jgi:dynein heavy chain